MRNRRPLALLALLLLLLPLSARAELTPVGVPLILDSAPFCSSSGADKMEVIATPKGAFEVVWADEVEDFVVKGQRFGRNLVPTSPPEALLPLHGGLFFSDFAGTFAGRYQLALNAADFDARPADPLTSYRLQLDLEGNPVATARFKPPRFLKIAPAAKGDSLQFRSEPPVFGPPNCLGLGLLASRINAGGAPLTAESRVTRRATPWNGTYLAVARLPNDTFIAAYSTCNGLVARRLNAAGAPVGKPIDLPLPGRVGNFAGVNLLVAAHSGTNFAVASMVSSTIPGASGTYLQAVVNGQVLSPVHLAPPIGNLVDLAISPTGGYLLLFDGPNSDPTLPRIFAQELDARGVPQGTPLALTGEGQGGVAGAAASLPDGRWIVVTRAQEGNETGCGERVVMTVLDSN